MTDDNGCRWTGILGVVLAISRAFIIERGSACEPELALLQVVAHTHWLPRHWRGRAHTQEVHDQFQSLFPFKVRILPRHPASPPWLLAAGEGGGGAAGAHAGIS